MGKEKFVRSKPHVNAEEEPALTAEPAAPGDPVPTESISFNFSKMSPGTVEPQPSLAGELKPPPPAEPAIGGTGTLTYTGLESAAASHDTHEIEEVSFTFQKIEMEQVRDEGGPSTLAALEPQGYGGPDSLGAEIEPEAISLLVPAVQAAREAANRVEDSESGDLDLDL